MPDDLFEKSVFFKTIFCRVFAVFGWGCGGNLELSGLPGSFFGGFWPFLDPYMGQTACRNAAGARSGYCQGIFFDVKTPKKHFQKCQICPKQVGMDSRATFGVYLCQRRFCDVKK